MDSNLIDVQYALRQLKGGVRIIHKDNWLGIGVDRVCVQKAVLALERVESRLKNPEDTEGPPERYHLQGRANLGQPSSGPMKSEEANDYTPAAFLDDNPEATQWEDPRSSLWDDDRR